MLLDASSGVGQSLTRPERPDSSPVPNDANRAHQPERSEAGRSSDIGPAVVTSFSAAAMELARPVRDVEQQADPERSADRMEREDRGVAQANREEQARVQREPQRYSSINVTV